MKGFLRVWSTALCMLMAAPPAHSQQPSPEASQPPPSETDPGFVIRTETRLALVPFHVVKNGKYVEGLRAEDIQLLEDGVPQGIAIFEGPPRSESGGRTIPIEVILLLDVSLSVMNHSLLDGFSLKETLLDRLGNDVRVSIYGFAGRLKRFTRPTNDLEKLKAALTGAYEYAHGGTRLYEAIMHTCRDAVQSGANANRLMVILSDSFSTTKTPPEKAETIARYYGITLYPVILGHDRVIKRAQGSQRGKGNWNPARGGRGGWGNQRIPGIGGPVARQQNQRNRQSRAHELESQMAKLAELGEATGGRSFDPRTINNMMIRGILESIVKQLQAEYVVGYYPASSDQEKTPHEVQVALRDKKTGKLYGGNRLVVH